MILSSVIPLIAGAAPENIWDITVGPYTNLLGGYFWAIILLIMAALVYLKSNSIGPTSLVLIIGFSVLTPFIPGDTQPMFIFFVWIGVALAFYHALVRRKPY